jgi:acetoin utilization deacetylase AcuC-like enzyme
LQIFYTDHFVLPLPDGHRFPMEKYARLRALVDAAGLAGRDALSVPHAATDVELLRAHDRGYLQRVVDGTLAPAEMKRIGFPWTPQMVERSRRSAGATIEACRAALERGVGVNLAGGTHHAFRDRGEGYCVFNDSAVAALAMQAEGRARRVAILDCDVHQGNGTAAILAEDVSVFTFSIHGANNFPFRKESSDLDIELPDGTTDDEYLVALEDGVCHALSAGRPTSRSISPAPTPSRMTASVVSHSRRTASPRATRWCFRCAATRASPWRSRWRAAMPATSTIRSTSISERSVSRGKCSRTTRAC